MESISIAAGMELVKVVGFGAIIFVVWIITIKFFDRILTQQEKRFSDLLAMQQNILDEQATRNQQNYELLKQLIESNEYVGGSLSTLSGKIDANLYCPLMRKELHSKS